MAETASRRCGADQEAWTDARLISNGVGFKVRVSQSETFKTSNPHEIVGGRNKQTALIRSAAAKLSRCFWGRAETFFLDLLHERRAIELQQRRSLVSIPARFL